MSFDLLSQCSDTSYLPEIDDNMPFSVNIDFSNGSPLNFLTVHYNINCITADGRLDELSDVCRVMKIDCLVLTESKIDDQIPSNILTISGFHEPIRRDRNRHGGGTMIYVAEHLTFKQQTLLQHDVFDHLWVDIKVCEKTHSVNALYRPSTQTTSDDYESFF